MTPMTLALVVLLIVFGAAMIAFIKIRNHRRRSLDILKAAIDRFARGELHVRIPSLLHSDLLPLVSSINRMASDLNVQLRALASQRNELDAVLSSMVEGVVAVDTEESIIRVNHAAADLLKIDDEIAARGRPIQEVVRNSDFEAIVRDVLRSQESLEREITLHDGRNRVLEAHASLLKDPDGQSIGALMVLNDMTKLKRLESVRRDFVANVSHELKTPITSIKGFVETLLDGAVDNPQESRRFLDIVRRQSERLQTIIEDLLTLSQIEQGDWRETLRLEDASLYRVLRSAIDICASRAASKNISLVLECPEDLHGRINSSLLEQATVNLIDNAIKYSESDTTVRVTVTNTADEIVLSVKDQGCGIQEAHLARIFERFYRVDEGRSRKIGGTGLGLAIVKHIAQVHGGRASVASVNGKGSEFSVHLPRASNEE